MGRSRHEMGCVLANNDRWGLGPHAGLLTNRLALVVVEFGSRAKRMAAKQGTRGEVHRVLARELALHVI